MTLKIIYKDINSLIPYVNNARTHSDEQVTQIASSIKEFNFTNPILIDEQGNRECDVAFDMWRKIIRKDDFKMGSEPAITIVEIDDE